MEHPTSRLRALRCHTITLDIQMERGVKAQSLPESQCLEALHLHPFPFPLSRQALSLYIPCAVNSQAHKEA